MEEWNEYGELKENVGSGAPPIATTPSVPSTPSKTPSTMEAPSKGPILAGTRQKPTQSSTTGSSLTTTMRQVGFEAAKKADESKSHARAKVFEDLKLPSNVLKKLDNSAPKGFPPPTGMTEAASAIAPETGSSSAKSTADNVGIASEQPDISVTKLQSPGAPDTGPATHMDVESNPFLKEAENSRSHSSDTETLGADSKPTEKQSKDDDAQESELADRVTAKAASEPRVSANTQSEERIGPLSESRGLEARDTVAKHVEAEEVGVERTQDQPAASGKEAGTSVGD